MPFAMAGVLVVVACAMWLLAHVVEHAVERQTRRRHELIEQARLKLNAERAERGLEPFPTVAALQAAAEQQARTLHPQGLRLSDAANGPEPQAPITYGVFVVPETIPHPAARQVPLEAEFTWVGDPYFAGIADECARQGRHIDANAAIVIFYAALMALYPFAPRQQVMDTVAEIMAHELRHLVDAEEHVPYGRSLARDDDVHNYWWHRRRKGRGQASKDGT